MIICIVLLYGRSGVIFDDFDDYSVKGVKKAGAAGF